MRRGVVDDLGKPDPEAARLAQATEAAYAAVVIASANLFSRKRRALEQAFDAAQNAEGNR